MERPSSPLELEHRRKNRVTGTETGLFHSYFATVVTAVIKDRQRDRSVLHLSLPLPSLKVKDRPGDRSVLLTRRPVCSTQAQSPVWFTPVEIPVCLHIQRQVCLHRQQDRSIYTGRETDPFTQAERQVCLHKQREIGLVYHRLRDRSVHTGKGTGLVYTGTDR